MVIYAEVYVMKHMHAIVMKEFKRAEISTCSSIVWEFGEWHVPCWKFPQVPKGVPKLANLIAEIDWPGAHRR